MRATFPPAWGSAPFRNMTPTCTPGDGLPSKLPPPRCSQSVQHPPWALNPRVVPADDMLKIATDSKNLGFKGVICPHPSWVEPVNNAFTPTESQVEYYTQVRQVFSQAIAAGTAAVPFQWPNDRRAGGRVGQGSIGNGRCLRRQRRAEA